MTENPYVDCPSCAGGNHDGHDPLWGVIPGAGGVSCPCVGDCGKRNT